VPRGKNSAGVIEILKVCVPEDLTRRVKVFCANSDMTIGRFAIDALVEKLDQWKE
jgi:hypothetical protein